MGKRVRKIKCSGCKRKYPEGEIRKFFLRRYMWTVWVCRQCRGKCLKCGTAVTSSPFCRTCLEQVRTDGADSFPAGSFGTTRGLKKASGSSHAPTRVDKVQAGVPEADRFDSDSEP